MNNSQPPNPVNMIPFSQRQSRSEVAAYIALKKGQKVQAKTADEMILQTVEEYDKLEYVFFVYLFIYVCMYV